MSGSELKPPIRPVFASLTMAALTVFLYSAGWSGTLYYDDIAPLGGLARVDDALTAAEFTLGSDASVLGRPLAMASFLPHAAGWPASLSQLLMVNSLIHAGNGLLVALLTYLLLNLWQGSNRRHGWIAFAAASLWLLLPINVTTSLIAIQRMNGLAAFFVFSGLCIHLAGLRLQAHRPLAGAGLQTIGLGAFSVLALLCKENGALLPLYALVLEATLLRGWVAPGRLSALRRGVLCALLLALLVYLVVRALTSGSEYEHRTFSLYQRLITEPALLWQYLRQAVLPGTFDINPFHDDVQAYTSLFAQLAAPLALAAWGTLIGLAFRYRRPVPMLGFGLAWYLVGHLLESTSIGLELYFEHRNYLPLVGPCVALAWAVGQIAAHFPRIAKLAFGAYLALLAAILFQVTALWGNPQMSAELWAMQQPGSARAAAHLATYYNNEMHRPEVALHVLDRTVRECPECLAIRTQALAIACALELPIPLASRIHDFKEAFGKRLVSSGITESLAVLAPVATAGQCGQMDSTALERIFASAITNPRIAPNSQAKANLFVLRAQLRQAAGDLTGAAQFLREAWQQTHDHAIGFLLADLWMDGGQTETLANFLDTEMCVERQTHTVKAELSRQRCEMLRGRLATGTLEVATGGAARP
ncbi:MAG: hypothetical protein KDG55_09475 [Rhodocyclaceae bacterium]|nr:hypothetical protein [Rhodocyclaceae bacterium]